MLLHTVYLEEVLLSQPHLFCKEHSDFDITRMGTSAHSRTINFCAGFLMPKNYHRSMQQNIYLKSKQATSCPQQEYLSSGYGWCWGRMHRGIVRVPQNIYEQLPNNEKERSAFLLEAI